MAFLLLLYDRVFSLDMDSGINVTIPFDYDEMSVFASDSSSFVDFSLRLSSTRSSGGKTSDLG